MASPLPIFPLLLVLPILTHTITSHTFTHATELWGHLTGFSNIFTPSISFSSFYSSFSSSPYFLIPSRAFLRFIPVTDSYFEHPALHYVFTKGTSRSISYFPLNTQALPLHHPIYSPPPIPVFFSPSLNVFVLHFPPRFFVSPQVIIPLLTLP